MRTRPQLIGQWLVVDGTALNVDLIGRIELEPASFKTEYGPAELIEVPDPDEPRKTIEAPKGEVSVDVPTSWRVVAQLVDGDTVSLSEPIDDRETAIELLRSICEPTPWETFASQ